MYTKEQHERASREFEQFGSVQSSVNLLGYVRTPGAEFCDIVNTMELGESNKTEILLMPERCYCRWNLDRTK